MQFKERPIVIEGCFAFGAGLKAFNLFIAKRLSLPLNLFAVFWKARAVFQTVVIPAVRFISCSLPSGLSSPVGGTIWGGRAAMANSETPNVPTERKCQFNNWPPGSRSFGTAPRKNYLQLVPIFMKIERMLLK